MNFQDKIGSTAGKNTRDIIIDHEVYQIYDLLWYFRASKVKIWH